MLSIEYSRYLAMRPSEKQSRLICANLFVSSSWRGTVCISSTLLKTDWPSTSHSTSLRLPLPNSSSLNSASVKLQWSKREFFYLCSGDTMEIYVGNQYSSEFIEDVHAVKYLTGKISKGTNLQVFFSGNKRVFFNWACFLRLLAFVSFGVNFFLFLDKVSLLADCEVFLVFLTKLCLPCSSLRLIPTTEVFQNIMKPIWSSLRYLLDSRLKLMYFDFYMMRSFLFQTKISGKVYKYDITTLLMC